MNGGKEMEKITIKFANCYGIKKLEHELDFSKNSNCLIYASNGTMKTSFSKVFKALSLGKKPSDEVFQRATVCSVKKEDGSDLLKEEIFAISSYEDEYISPNTAKLIVNKELKAKYDNELNKVTSLKNQLLSHIKEYIDSNVDIEKELTASFERQPIDFLDLLLELLSKDISKHTDIELPFSKVDYEDIFNEGVQKFVSDPKNLVQIKEYAEKYDELLENTKIFKRGVFSHYNAENLSLSLNDNGFFEAEHEVLFNGLGKPIKKHEDYMNFIEQEKNKIFVDPALKKKFDRIDKELGKRALSSFRKVIEQLPEIIPMLSDYTTFRQSVWISIVKRFLDDAKALVETYKICNATVMDIKSTARKEKTQWDIVLEIFKDRFSVPFKIEIPNQDDVLLNNSVPEFVFKYIDPDTEEETDIGRKNLEKVLSQGEKRALYLLNIIYDLEVLKLNGNEMIVIADDISDSFDYKNKYAIIEYLQDMSTVANLKFIILTHNFDFYRTTASRLANVRPYMVAKIKNGIELINPKYIYRNPFSLIKSGMSNGNDADIITSIPFVRNIIEYTSNPDNDGNYKKLTSLLHIKADTKEITAIELQDIFNIVLTSDKALDFAIGRETKKVHVLIMEQAKQIVINGTSAIDLEGKIILSIAMRLLAEDFMIEEILKLDGNLESIDEVRNSGNNQTGKLLKMFKAKFPAMIEAIGVLNKVVLMSSENIHINSFMFEPIIDMSVDSLVSLYGKLSIYTSK